MSTHPVLDELSDLAESFRAQFVAPIELPEPAPRLGLQERTGQPARQFKHLHQMCLGHVEHLALSGRIKLLALLDGYLSAVSTGAVIGDYLFARTVIEQCAFTCEVQRRLAEVSRKPEANWLPKGEEFFSLVIRFRFATADKALQRHLESQGIPQKLLKPVNVMNCIAALVTSPDLAQLAPLYEQFCDYVHHNGPSHYTTSSGFFVDSVASHHASGGAILTKKAGPISRYEYPTTAKAQKAIDDTVNSVVLAAGACNRMLTDMHRSPYTMQQIKQMTGNELGMVYLGKASPQSKPS